MASTPRMPRMPSASSIRSQMRTAQNKAEREARRELDKAVNEANRDFERRVKRASRQSNRDLERRLQRAMNSQPSAGPPAAVNDAEYGVLEDLSSSLDEGDTGERALFLSYAHSDGGAVAGELHEQLTAEGVTVWYDQKEIKPGKSQSRQMDHGLTHARAGVVLLTPAFLAGRFWTERELGVLLGKPTVVPVVHGVTFEQVKRYSGMLADMAGFSTADKTPAQIAGLIAAAVLDEPDAA